MSELAIPDAYGVLTDPATLRIERLLPGPVERIWDYLTKSDMRRKWLASGEMEMKVGAATELVWRNHELTDPPGQRPEGFGEEHRMQVEITELVPLRRLAITWGSTGGVSFDLEPKGSDVLLTVTHRRVAHPGVLLNVSAGWHAHLDILAARATGQAPAPFWDSWQRLKAEYTQRL